MAVNTASQFMQGDTTMYHPPLALSAVNTKQACALTASIPHAYFVLPPPQGETQLL